MIYTFDSAQAGAPVLSGTAGALATVLKACLVDGFGASAVASLVVADGIAKATYAATHPFRVGSVARFAGATPTSLNGEKIVAATTANSVTFAAPGVPDGAATGTITSRMAPAGWQELFAGTVTNVLVLKPQVIESTGCVLRVNDTGTTTARVMGYESMSDIQTGAGPFPTDSQVAGGLYWPKSDQASGSTRPWRLFADDRTFVLWVAPSGVSHGVCVSFGDLLADWSADAYACVITGGPADVSTRSSVVEGCLGYGHGISLGADVYVPRAHTGVGSAQLAKKLGAYNTGAAYSGAVGYNGNTFAYPNPADNSLRLSPVELQVGRGVRGRFAGVCHCPQQLADSFSTGDIVSGSGDFAGLSFMALRVGPPGAALANAGTVFVGCSGSWRG